MAPGKCLIKIQKEEKINEMKQAKMLMATHTQNKWHLSLSTYNFLCAKIQHMTIRAFAITKQLNGEREIVIKESRNFGFIVINPASNGGSHSLVFIHIQPRRVLTKTIHKFVSPFVYFKL